MTGQGASVTGLRVAHAHASRIERLVLQVEAAQVEGRDGAEVVVHLVRHGQRVDDRESGVRPHRTPDGGGRVVAHGVRGEAEGRVAQEGVVQAVHEEVLRLRALV